MSQADLQFPWVISVAFEQRSDGGLRVYSDDVPGFMLSHHDPEAVLKDVRPALETIVGAMLKRPVTIVPAEKTKTLPWFAPDTKEVREYVARSAA